MKKNLVITVTSEDRPGIVERITEVLLEYGANLEESRMARLGGEFAGIMLTAADEDRADALSAALAALADEGITADAKAAHPSCAIGEGRGVAHEIQLSGVDHEGIVHGITDFLAEQGVNIEDLATDMVPAPLSGTPLFNMRAIVLVPETLGTIELRDKLNAVGDRLGVDLLIKPIRR